jgi:hypothetical protein
MEKSAKEASKTYEEVMKKKPGARMAAPTAEFEAKLGAGFKEMRIREFRTPSTEC